MRKPNFFIVGAPRCGTASMYAYLKQHPEIYVSVDKEPHFFGSDLTPQPGTIREEDLYLRLFAGAGDRPRLGEASVWYLSSKRAPSEIRAFAPDAKIVILLRSPAQMAYSLYSLYTRTGNEDLPTFEEALAAEPERRRGSRIPQSAYYPEGLLYTDAARYAEKVERYFEVFGRDNVHCIVFDDFVRDTAAVYRKTLEFLGVDPGFQAELDPRRANQQVRMTAIRQLRQLPPELLSRIRFKEMKQHDRGPARPLLEETAARLRQLFAADVARLGSLLGRDLGAWTSGARELRKVDDQALMGAGADDAGRRLDLDVEAEQPALRDPGQLHADGDLLARAGGADVGDVDAGADRGLAVVEQRLDEREAGVLGEADHARGREDALDVRGPHVGSHGVGGLVRQAGGEPGAGHERG